MRATVNRILKNNDETMGVCEITINDKELNCTLKVSNDEDIENKGVPMDIDLCLFSDNFDIISDPAEKKESISQYITDDEMETYCIVKGKIMDVSSFEEQLFLDIECLGHILNIVSYRPRVIPIEKGNYISALCWIQMIEDDTEYDHI